MTQPALTQSDSAVTTLARVRPVSAWQQRGFIGEFSRASCAFAQNVWRPPRFPLKLIHMRGGVPRLGGLT